MKRILAIATLLLSLNPARADLLQVTTYYVDMNIGPLTATGSIITDGYIGAFPNTTMFQANHITGLNITLTDGTYSDTFYGGVNARIGGIQGFALAATPTELKWNFDCTNCLFNFFTGLAMTEMGFGAGIVAAQIYDHSIGVVAEGTEYRTGWQTIGSIETPLPGALFMFAPGLLALLLISRRT